ncbi:MAG: glutamate-5-semialdehyde dehydrogenase [Bacteroidaceae bacterium]|nr:glutamate-5-semialdehyde dehydrogenase [Bacteroidaceae bacterium]
MNSEDIKTASRLLAACSESEINALLVDIADELERRIPEVLEANAKDQARMDPANPMFDRLVLNEERLRGIAADTRKVATLPSPLGRTLEERTLPNGLEIKRVSVPFGVIGVIYEARPNVTVDVASLCLKAGSACILKGGSDADDSCQALVRVIHAALSRHGLPAEAVTLLPATREATAELLAARGLVDVLIPRGSSRLINYVRENASVPVIETGAGVVHCYVDGEADLDMAARIVENAKCRRVSVCNALDCLLVDKSLESQLDRILAPMQGRVTFHRDEASWGTEWLSYDLAIRLVDGVDGAMDHIRRFGSGHSESIVTQNRSTAEKFLRGVDAACVYWNAPTSFTDGAQFGLGAEIGISTQKLHARGPMALEAITTYKWTIKGNGQTRI